MNILKYRIAFILLIPMLFFNLSASALLGAAHAAKELGHSSTHNVSIFNVDSADHCPACPTEDHPSNDHSHPSCEHHSSLFFGSQPLLIPYNPNITIHTLAEPLNAIPEVYLEKFIPPQILA
jgi:hypothetical protein